MAQESPQPTGKGRPTPSRKEREAARKRPLVLDRKQDVARRRAERRVQLAKEHEAMMSGDERNMPVQHAGQPRRFARDYVDSRTTIAEFLLPFSLVALFGMMFLSRYPDIVTILSLVVLLMMIVGGLEAWVLARRLRARAAEKFGEDRLPRMYRLYTLTRMLQVRRLRMPKPRVQRGEFPQ